MKESQWVEMTVVRTAEYLVVSKAIQLVHLDETMESPWVEMTAAQ